MEGFRIAIDRRSLRLRPTKTVEVGGGRTATLEANGKKRPLRLRSVSLEAEKTLEVKGQRSTSFEAKRKGPNAKD